jgi:lysophospholipase L1-like esterase
MPTLIPGIPCLGGNVEDSMTDLRADNSRSCKPRGRRRFLAEMGAAACGGALGRSGSVRATAAPDTAPQKGTGLAGIKQLLAEKTARTWVFTGDSITHGALHTLGWRSYPEHFAERVRWELRRMRDVVINTGISGDRTGGLLADLDWRVLRFKPDVVSVMLGMNDCSAGPGGCDTFRKNLAAIVDKVQATGAIPLLNTPNTIHVKNARGRADLPAYAEVVRNLAEKGKFALVDHWQHWRKTKPNQEDLLAWLEDRSIHPNVYGHRAFARLIFRTLGIFDPKSPTCQLEVP